MSFSPISFELFVALRYLFARKGQAFISVISWVSVGGVALGVFALIVVMAVMNGFTTDLRDKIIGVTSHGVIRSYMSGIPEDPDMLAKITAVPGVAAATPFIHSGVLLSSSAGGSGIYLRGIDPVSGPKVLGGLKKVKPEELAELASTEGLPGIIIGSSLARNLAVHVGSRVNLLAPSGEQSSAGHSPRIRPFRVVGIFSMGLADYDSALAFVSLDKARDVLGWKEKLVSGIEVAITDIFKAPEILDKTVSSLAHPDLYANSWMEMNANLFAALKLEKISMAVILTLVVLVGSFSIITALVMLVMEKRRDIAVLMSLGATKGMIRKIFITQGILIGVMGTSIGFIFGLGSCFLLKRYKFIELPRGVYSLDYLPVLLNWSDIGLTCLCAMLLCFFATLYPAGQASSLEPVTALRHE
jgi:lipoprotein releasing system, transmembrane protein, LolC/E family